MKKVVILSVFGTLIVATPALAQFGAVQQAPNTWVSGWVGGYLDPGTVQDFESASHWNFGSSFATGASIHRRVGSGLQLGLDASYAPVRYERTDAETGALLDDGTATILTALASGRLRYGGSETFGMYLTGGVGTFVYGMPEPVDRWDPDLALMTGAGIEYRPSGNRALFVEWGRYWTFHQREGVQDNSTRHSRVRVGGRVGW